MRLKEPTGTNIFARLGALFYTAWGFFHIKVAWDIAKLGLTEPGLTQGRIYQLAAYMLTIALFVIGVALLRNWRNDRLGFWLNVTVAGWADAIWVLVVVLPGYVDPIRGFVPAAIFAVAAILTWFGQYRRNPIVRDRRHSNGT